MQCTRLSLECGNPQTCSLGRAASSCAQPIKTDEEVRRAVVPTLFAAHVLESAGEIVTHLALNSIHETDNPGVESTPARAETSRGKGYRIPHAHPA